MAQFHPFGGLPKELRDCIWDMAIRDDDPSVHFFTIYDPQDDPPSVVNPAKKVHATRASCVPGFSIGFAAPRRRGSDQLSWTDGNLSAYLTDSGLWTTCHESRERMLRYFRPFKTSPQVSKRMPVDWSTVQEMCDKPTALINMEFIRDNGERQYLTVRPSKDLLCLRLPDNSSISWDSRHHWQLIQDFPLFRWHGNEWPWYSSCITNVAVEYNPAWETFDHQKDRGPFTGITGGFSKVDEIHGLMTFWFIDYRLTRKYQSEDCERQTSRAGKLTFIEVDAIDYEWCCCPKKDGRCLDRCDQGPAKHKLYGAHALAGHLELHNEMQADEAHEVNPGEIILLEVILLEIVSFKVVA
ncbi:hypothetical protein INS49_007377 [Diaporthe citri]|uniref:uncharacterized protein n=1 Tax=Diaporthe citri TaxID=83186 RepID=UPI001C7F25FF|nr:uncharacterized protein INS49_007377 [Diaporthe citri]KAG6365766.1 hypothetical protein INS49_007377 [Diaporthe citri]